MPRFEPFPAVRYDPARVSLDDVIAPPYDVIGVDDEARLAARSPYNAVRVELSSDHSGADSYDAARRHFEQWLASGVLLQDPEPGFYVYRMGYRSPDGSLRQTSGVLGALELSPFGSGGVLPHERTLPKAKDDRLRLLRACRANLSPIWGLSLAPGLSGLCEPAGPPISRCTGDDGVHHRLWRVTQPAVVEAIVATVGSAPVVIADGHHRYETALAYRDERRAGDGGTGDWDLVLAYVVELAGDQLSVGPIHRAVRGLPDGFDALAALQPWLEPVAEVQPGPELEHQMLAAAALSLVTPAGTWLLRPRPQAADGQDQPDAALLDTAMATWPAHDTAYEHSAERVFGSVASGRAQAGLVLRPATVGQIAAAAHAERRLPEKTTFFHPKPATGLVFRRLEP